MKKPFLIALVAAMLLPALPGAAELPGPTPSPQPTPTATATSGFAQTTDTTTDPGPTTQGRTLTYAGRGITSGLSLTITGQGLRTGITATRVANAATTECQGVACATAAGAGDPLGESATATSPGSPGPDAVQAFDIGDDASEELEQLLTGTIGRATAQTADQPSAEASAEGLTTDITLAQTILGELPAEVTEGLQGGIDQLVDALAPITDADPTGVTAGIAATLRGLLADLSSGPLVRIQAGVSESDAEFEAGRVSASATAAGAVITLLPTPASTPLLPQGVAIIEVGRSSAEASANGTDRATTDAEASIARITLLPGVLDGIDPGDGGDGPGLPPLEDILDLLPPELVDLLPIDDLPLPGLFSSTTGQDAQGNFLQADENSGGFVIDLTTGTEQTCALEDTPLEFCVTLGGTSETFTADGLGVGVLAAGVDVSLIRGAGEFTAAGDAEFSQVPTGPGVVELNIARSEAGAAAAFVAPPPPPPAPSPTQTPRPLPQTGSGFMVPSVLLMLLSGMALYGLRRRRDVV